VLPAEATVIPMSASELVLDQVARPATRPIRGNPATARIVLETLRNDLEAINTPESESTGIHAMVMVLTSFDLIDAPTGARLVAAAYRDRSQPGAEDDLLEAVLVTRPIGWGYCVSKDKLGGRGNCAQINPPTQMAKPVPSITGAFSRVIAAARAIVIAHQQILEDMP